MADLEGDVKTNSSEIFLKTLDLAKINQRVKEAAKKVDTAESKALSPDYKVAETRHSLTKTFLYGFFIILILSGIFVYLYNTQAVNWVIQLHAAGLDDRAANISLLELDKVLSIMISALGTSLGFIIGYYFKDKH